MATEGRIRTEAHDHVFRIIIDNPAKKNAFSPQMMEDHALHRRHDRLLAALAGEQKSTASPAPYDSGAMMHACSPDKRSAIRGF